MSAAAQAWEPGRNAVHRLLQLCDVLAIALNRFRQRSFKLPCPPDLQFALERDRLQNDYFAITNAVFPNSDTAPQNTAFRLATDAVAEMVRAGSSDEQSVRTAQEWISSIGWILVPYPYPQWTTATEMHIPFEQDGRTLERHGGVRQGLLVALAKVGQSLPTHIVQRASLAVHSWSQSQVEPVTQAQLLDWVRETHPADIPAPATPPPTGTGGNEGGKANASFKQLLLAAIDESDLSKAEAKVIRIIAEKNGSVPIVDANTLCNCDALSAFKRAKTKLRKCGWQLHQHHESLCAKPLKQRGRN